MSADHTGLMQVYKTFGRESLPSLKQIAFRRTWNAKWINDHATTIKFVDSDGNIDLRESLELSKTYEKQFMSIVGEETGLDSGELSVMRTYQPKLFWEVAENIILQGHFNEKANLKSSVIELLMANKATIGPDDEAIDAGTAYVAKDLLKYLEENPAEQTTMTLPDTPAIVLNAINEVENNKSIFKKIFESW